MDLNEKRDEGDEMLLTTQQVAERLALTDRTVRKLVAAGDLRAVRIGKSVRFRPSDLRAYIRAAAGDP